jgi:hypothetical protein
MHQQLSRTYGGRNTPQQITQDRQNLRDAAQRDLEKYRETFLQRGVGSKKIDEIF